MKTAVLSPCGDYRYSLTRRIHSDDGVLKVCVIMVNPSTADHIEDDHTITKLIGFGERNRWAEFDVGNLFALRSKDVGDLAKHRDPVGPRNDDHLIEMLARCDQVVIAWGPLAKQPRLLRNRYLTVLSFIDGAGLDPYCIGPTAKCGQPKHPLTLGYALPVQRWIDPKDPLLQ